MRGKIAYGNVMANVAEISISSTQNACACVADNEDRKNYLFRLCENLCTL